MSLEITPVTTIEECRMIEAMEKTIWHSTDAETVPDHILLTIAKNGGVVLLAKQNAEPVGFALGFLGMTPDGRLKHCSHQTGVMPGYQNSGVGYQLKLAQRESVMAQGINRITWTFDPLQSRNAYFNMRKLGAVSNTYFRELYGTMRDGLNAGLPSDRLEASWWLDSEPVQLRLAGKLPSPKISTNRIINRCTRDSRGFPLPPESVMPLTDSRHFLQIPADINAIKMADMPLAMAWRAHSRQLFEQAFARGYTLTDFVFLKSENSAFYALDVTEI